MKPIQQMFGFRAQIDLQVTHVLAAVREEDYLLIFLHPLRLQQFKQTPLRLRVESLNEGEAFAGFLIKDERHTRYWMEQACPVLLVIRNAKGEVRWMEMRDWLKRESENGQKTVKQIVFEGERFDVMNVRRWRDRVLRQGLL